MVIGENRHVVRRWPSERTCGGDYVKDDTGQVWRILDPWDSPNSISNTTGVEVRQLYPNGDIR